MTWFGRWVVRSRKGILLGTLLLLVVGGPWAPGAYGALDLGNLLNPPTSEASQATSILADQFGSGSPNLVLLVEARRGTVDSVEVVEAGRALTDEATRLLGVAASSYWTLGSPPELRSKDAGRALVLVRIPGSDNEVDDRVRDVVPLLERDNGTIGVKATGEAQVWRQLLTISETDVRRAEVMVTPLLLVLLALVFGSVVAAFLPLVVAVLSVVFTYVALRLLAQVTFVHVNMLPLVSLLAMGLAVDYCLFIISRFREELAAGRPAHEAVVRTVETAGVTVLFSAAAVSLSLAAVMVFPPYLNCFAFVGLAPAIAGVGAVVSLPALLAVLGPNIDRMRLFRRAPVPAGQGFWRRLSIGVMRRPVPVAAGSIAFLVLLGVPFLGAEFSTPDERALPEGASSRAALSEIRRSFSSNDSSALSVVSPTSGDSAQMRTELSRYASELSALPGVARVDALTGGFSSGRQVSPDTPITRRRFGDPTGRGTWLSVVPSSRLDPLSSEGEELVRQVRHTRAPFAVKVGGQSAQLVDTKAATFGRFPLMLGIIAAVTLATLFLMLGSVVVPIKAVILNVLSLSATLGAMVWVFQQGHGAGLLDITPTPLDTFAPILVFCTAFGLSMDYEVFLLSRIKEEHDRGADNVSAVATGLEYTGRIVTAAAALLAAVFVFAGITNSITYGKLFGIALSLAVLVDATIIRGLLVPAFMRLAGNANWWAPSPLRRLHSRVGLHHTPSDPEPADSAPDPELVTF